MRCSPTSGRIPDSFNSGSPTRGAVLTEMAHAFDVSWAERLWHFLIERKLLRGETPHYVLQLVFEMGHRLFDVGFQRSPMGDDATIDGARRMLTAYLGTYASAAPHCARIRY